MSIKEKDLESLFLTLLDTSSAIQSRIRDICLLESLEIKQDPRLDESIEQLKCQLVKSQNEYKQTVSKMQEYKNFSENLESDLKKAKSEIAACEHRFREQEYKNSQLKEAECLLRSKLDDVNEKFRVLKDCFSNPIILLDRYKSLPASIRIGLSDVICDKDEILFIASCSNSEHLKAIWTYTKKLAGSNDDVNNVVVLKDIFDYFFDVLNNSLQEPMYVRDSVEVGYLFDDDKYDRCIGSSTSGKITQVILRGYKSINTGNIICRSFVYV